MLTLFELFNLPIDCWFQWVPVYGDEVDWCRIWTWETPNNTCEIMKECVSSWHIYSFLSWSSYLSLIDNWDNISIELNDLTIGELINSTWIAPVLTIWNNEYNLSSLLNNSNTYWNIHNPTQENQWESSRIIWNKWNLVVWWIDWMKFFYDNDPTSPTNWNLVAWLPFEFITTPLWTPTEYAYNYWIQNNPSSPFPLPTFDTHYNPRRYVLTRYKTFARDWESRNCGKAVWAEPQCCMQTLTIDWCMLWLTWGDVCEWRCQTIRNQINWSERVSICNIFKQNLSINTNTLCYTIPGIIIPWTLNVADFATDPSAVTTNDWDTYIVWSWATWSRSWHENDIAQWSDAISNWNFTTPLNTYRVNVLAWWPAIYWYDSISASWSTIPPEVCVDLAWTNNHYLKTYPGSWTQKNILELHNSIHNINSSMNLDFMFNQTLVHNEVPVTPQPTHPVPTTINNTVCITQPLGAADQCVDLNKVNDQEIYLEWRNLIINSVLDPLNDCDNDCSWRVLDMTEYFQSWKCSEACDCVMDSVPDWYSIIPEPAEWRPTWWTDFLDSNPSVFAMMEWLVEHIADVYNTTAPSWIDLISLWYTRPCNLYSDSIDDVIPEPECDSPYCCEPCWWWNTTIIEWIFIDNRQTNIWISINEKKHHAKRWVTSDREVTQSFNWVLDWSWDVCDSWNHNVWRTIAWSNFDWNYWWNPSGLPASRMTNTPALMWLSAIKIVKDWSYNVYIDWPIEVNHMVHAFRISLIVNRWWDQIMIQDWKMSWDPESWSGSVNNWYFKESKQYYVSSFKSIELLKDDILTLQVKIDANVSWPWDDLDPITLWQPGNDSTLWTIQAYSSSDYTADWIYTATWWTEWNSTVPYTLDNKWVYIEYGWPSSPTNQNFNALVYGWAPTENTYVYNWLNWFVRTAHETLTRTLTHTWTLYPAADHAINVSHQHPMVARFPAIAPQAPKYIHFDSTIEAGWNYPWRYTPAHLNPNSTYDSTEQYSNTWIDANWIVKLLAKSWLDESSCPSDSHYTEISPQSWFSFWIERIKWLRPDQVEIYP